MFVFPWYVKMIQFWIEKILVRMCNQCFPQCWFIHSIRIFPPHSIIIQINYQEVTRIAHKNDFLSSKCAFINSWEQNRNRKLQQKMHFTFAITRLLSIHIASNMNNIVFIRSACASISTHHRIVSLHKILIIKVPINYFLNWEFKPL